MSAPVPHPVGIGLRQPHYEPALAQRPALGFVELHSENFFADGGAALGVLHAARERWPVSLHGVGLALGSAAGIDAWHLERLARLVQRIEPARVSDHASFARAPRRRGEPPVHANDLLPIAFTEASLVILAANVQRVQERLKRALLVENLSAYLQWADDRIAEPQFFNELVARTGCGLLLDVNNLVVNALNDGRDEDAAAQAACRWVDAIEPGCVGEIHLAGYSLCASEAGAAGHPGAPGEAGFGAGGRLVIDDHGSRVHAPVWQVYRHTLRRLGVRPTLVEWDTDLPAFEVLLGEAAAAAQIADAVAGERRAAVAEPVAA